MANTPDGERSSDRQAVDAAADLALLNRARSHVHIDQFLDFGPWWYAPLIATLIGGLTIFIQDPGNIIWHGVVGAVAAAAGLVTAVHDSRRRATRTRPSTEGMLYLVALVFIAWLVIAGWGTAISTLGEARFIPGYAALSWALTTLLFLALRTVLLTIRRRRAPLQ